MTATHEVAEPGPSLQLAGPPRTRLLFTGPPQGLSGSIPLVNRSDAKLKLRSIELKSQSLKGVASLPLGVTPFFAKLYPGEQANVPGMIVLDSSTPPGNHQFEISVGGTTMAAEAHVEEVVDLRMAPSQITILAGSATDFTRTFIAENAGNVDLPTGAQCETPILDSNDIVSAMVSGINDSDKSTVEAMVKGILLHWGDLHAGTLVTRRDPIVLHPGQKLAVDVHFHLPATLKPLRHYWANLQLYNATLSVDIYTTANYGRKPEHHGDKSKRKAP
ncbi:MAG: hypothetical protein JSS21_01695 [Proteobacteria bacterium]|nr:hypothetical protein [Pseudomonadota bacterium]